MQFFKTYELKLFSVVSQLDSNDINVTESYKTGASGLYLIKAVKRCSIMQISERFY